ncbi:MAG: hypothetical protein CMB80_02095 [Flammeovirgaceae bacterium]|jgi:hypothetical protein|nr:hypothetical protein [Flammeovirgaceae bacterium]
MSEKLQEARIVAATVANIIEERNHRLEEEASIHNGGTGEWISVLANEDAGLEKVAGLAITFPDGTEYTLIVERS